MKKKIFGSMVLVGMALTSAKAVDVNFFGHIGGAYNQGLSQGNAQYSVDGKKATYTGITGHVGMDLGFNALHFGVGLYGAMPIYGTKLSYTLNGGANGTQHTINGNEADIMYSKNYIDLSDLYLMYDNSNITLAVGRFNNEFLGSEWLNAYMQGVAFKYQSKMFGVWGAWMNDFTTYGYAPNRIASELMSYHRFPSSFNNFGIGNEVFAAGMNFDFDFLTFDPFVNYYLNKGFEDMAQAGANLALIFGKEGGAVQSTTTFKFMWQNILGKTGDSTMMLLGDEELIFGGIFKLGGGVFGTTGGNGIVTINDGTRFYGQRYLTPNFNYWSSAYFTPKNATWYIFTGVKSAYFDLDILYADGDCKEFSAIASFTVFETQSKGSLNGVSVKLGGGYVNNGFKVGPQQRSNVVAFAKLSF